MITFRDIAGARISFSDNTPVIIYDPGPLAQDPQIRVLAGMTNAIVTADEADTLKAALDNRDGTCKVDKAKKK